MSAPCGTAMPDSSITTITTWVSKTVAHPVLVDLAARVKDTVHLVASVSGAIAYMPPRRMRALEPVMVEAARRISAELGYRTSANDSTE